MANRLHKQILLCKKKDKNNVLQGDRKKLKTQWVDWEFPAFQTLCCVALTWCDCSPLTGSIRGQGAVSGQQTWQYSGYSSSLLNITLLCYPGRTDLFLVIPVLKPDAMSRIDSRGLGVQGWPMWGEVIADIAFNGYFTCIASWVLTSLHCSARMQYSKLGRYWRGFACSVYAYSVYHFTCMLFPKII